MHIFALVVQIYSFFHSQQRKEEQNCTKIKKMCENLMSGGKKGGKRGGKYHHHNYILPITGYKVQLHVPITK